MKKPTPKALKLDPKVIAERLVASRAPVTFASEFYLLPEHIGGRLVFGDRYAGSDNAPITWREGVVMSHGAMISLRDVLIANYPISAAAPEDEKVEE